jgi:hypothetical protein
VPLVAGVVAVLCLCVVVLGRASALLVSEAKARTAADAAALAGVSGGRTAATEMAAANGGKLLRFDVAADGSVTVEVAVGSATSSARAGNSTEGAARPESARG